MSKSPIVLALVILMALSGCSASGILGVVNRFLPGGGSGAMASVGDYHNGATFVWSFDLADAVGAGATFPVGQNNTTSNQWGTAGPVVLGDVWVAPYTDATSTGGLVAINPEDGSKVWDTTGAGMSLTNCSPTPLAEEVVCLGDADPYGSTPIVGVGLGTGSVRTITTVADLFDRSFAVSGDRIVAAHVDAASLVVDAYGSDGSPQWQTERLLGVDQSNDQTSGQSIIAQGDYVSVTSVGEETSLVAVMRATDGAVAAEGEGWATLLPSGFLVERQGWSPITTATNGLTEVVTDATPEVLVGQSGTTYLALFANDGASPVQWCQDLDPTRCTAVAGTDALAVRGVVETNGTATHLITGYSEDLETYALSGGETVDLTQLTGSPWYTGFIESGQVAVTSDADNLDSTGAITLVDALTGATIASADLPGWVPLEETPSGTMVLINGTDAWAPYTQLATFASNETSGGGLVTQTTTSGGGTRGECPSGTIELARATFTDGWVLVCGVNATSPTYWVSVDSTGQMDSSSVVWNADVGRYSASFPDGTAAWLNYTPGVYGRTTSGGTVLVQQAVGSIWFVSLDGASTSTGTASATGPYGVPIPEDTAEDQVRYLSDLLAASEDARSALQPAVIAVRECANGNGSYASEVKVIGAVADNRSTLLSALETAPVDRVPDGAALVSELRSALNHSLTADEEYLTWAKKVDASGCGAGSEASATSASKAAGEAKQVFVDHWNSTIAGTYAVPEVSREKL